MDYNEYYQTKPLYLQSLFNEVTQTGEVMLHATLSGMDVKLAYVYEDGSSLPFSAIYPSEDGNLGWFITVTNVTAYEPFTLYFRENDPTLYTHIENMIRTFHLESFLALEDIPYEAPASILGVDNPVYSDYPFVIEDGRFFRDLPTRLIVEDEHTSEDIHSLFTQTSVYPSSNEIIALHKSYKRLFRMGVI